MPPAVVGVYQLTVWARSAGNTADAAEATRTLAFTIATPPPPPPGPGSFAPPPPGVAGGFPPPPGA